VTVLDATGRPAEALAQEIEDLWLRRPA
jgi:hypothetical protein